MGDLHHIREGTTPNSSPGGNGGGEGNIRERLVKLETDFKYVATGKDVQTVITSIETLKGDTNRQLENLKVKSDMLLWIAGVGVTAIVIAVGKYLLG